MTSNLMRRITLKDRKSFRVAILGTRGVGKSALTVRFKTRKFIHSYAPNLEMNWKFDIPVDGEPVTFDLRDTAALQTAENSKVEEHIKWADAFILVYSITDEDSLSALVASRLLINLCAKRKRRSRGKSDSHNDLLVALIGNKNDLEHERMISEDQGRKFAEVNHCSHFFELSVRESYDSVKTVFDNLYRAYRIRRSKSPQRPTSIKLTSEPGTVSPTLSPSAEDNKILEYKQRGRTKTTAGISPQQDGARLSPATFRKIEEERSVYSSSGEEDHTFVGEEILYQDPPPASPSPSRRRVTVPSSPRITIRGFPSPNSLHRLNSSPHDTNNNSGGGAAHKLKIPIIRLLS